MSDNAIHIIPIHEGEYPNDAQKVQEILAWFWQRDLVEKTPSDCTLSEQQGYRFKPNIRTIFKERAEWAYDDRLLTHGLELFYGSRRVFHPMEGAYLEITCPHCHANIDEETGYQWISQWFENTGHDYPSCTQCHQQTHLSNYHIVPEWGFSNIGITLWNTDWHFNATFIDAMKDLYASDIMIIPVRI